MKLIMIPSVSYLCHECHHGVYYVGIAPKEFNSGVRVVKCVNPECKNKGKVMKVYPQVIEVEECVPQEAGKTS